MTAEQTPRALRRNIVIIGNRNVGKSSLINALTGQEVSIVSEEAGTTTDVVNKPYELLPFGPVTFMDTAGIDDDSSLGEARIKATKKALYRADLVLFVTDKEFISNSEEILISDIKEMKIPLIAVLSKTDKESNLDAIEKFMKIKNIDVVKISALAGYGIDILKEKIVNILNQISFKEASLLEGVVNKKDRVVLVAPIDSSAPKGRLILPQVQVLREILDVNATAIVVQPQELNDSIEILREKPSIVITDSQAVGEVCKIVNDDIKLTTFSILFARFKGDLKTMIEGANAIDKLEDGSMVLIAEACSHHAQDDDIAKVKIPNLLKKYTKKELVFSFATGCDFPENLEDFDLVVHCGACMLNKAEMNRRMNECVRRGIPVTNYGVAISKAQGILQRVIRPLGF